MFYNFLLEFNYLNEKEDSVEMSGTYSGSEWLNHRVYDSIDSEADLQDFVKMGDIQNVIDPIDEIADDMFELHHPELMHDESQRKDYSRSIREQGPSFGSWVHYPWLSSLVHFASPEDHYDMRTYRNRNLITKEEQMKLQLTRVAVIGLSVGSNVLDRLVQSGIGNQYDLFDMDKLSPANLNRIQAGMAQVGLHKTTVAGRKMAELDPFISQHHFTNGYEGDTTDNYLRQNRPDIIIEEVDNLHVKARLRQVAVELGVPLIMAGDVHDKSTLDVERHDIEEVQGFNGKLTDDQIKLLLSNRKFSDQEQIGLLVQMLGKENISPELLQSAMLKGKELAGIPQLGTTAAIGGAIASVAVRDILLGRRIPSGVNVFDAANFAKSVESVTISTETAL